jgi:hypothetical protein
MGGRTEHRRVFAALVLLGMSVSGCAVVVHHVTVEPLDRKDEVVIETRVKIHLKDGSTGLYASGATVSKGILRGKGDFYDIALEPFPSNPVLTPVSFHSIAVVGTFRENTNKGATTALLPVSILGSAAAVKAS